MVHPYLQAGYERVQCLKELKKSIRDGQLRHGMVTEIPGIHKPLGLRHGMGDTKT